ncbi:uncharacterized protein CTRU02_209003 [Colletotrichum truncatum]|uniref:Uncharacterized protein n=1 Tax=Colletotrichum truncatum TaxID=5467 RepID=A0ACC3YXU7_COLTU|nr:uncharacterized protein CTRU02_07805 [Colletotrichum truncatum]KAF6790899.1 hypothetical protein CTRU02_07805 [Colletotrichum truncatum]
MLYLQALLIALTSSGIGIKVLADDPGFCNNVALCTPCLCDAGGKCEGFCHHDRGSAGPKHCDLQSGGCKCPRGFELAMKDTNSTIKRRGGCFSKGRGGIVGAEPHGSCGQYNSYFACVASAPYYCRWDPTIQQCVDIRGPGKKKEPQTPTGSEVKKDPKSMKDPGPKKNPKPKKDPKPKKGPSK